MLYVTVGDPPRSAAITALVPTERNGKHLDSIRWSCGGEYSRLHIRPQVMVLGDFVRILEVADEVNNHAV